MKCPYREFKECIIEKCPSCIYEEVSKSEISGRYPSYISTEDAIKMGMAWKSVKTSYEFILCKLIDNNVPLPNISNEIIKNTTKTNVSIRKSIF